MLTTCCNFLHQPSVCLCVSWLVGWLVSWFVKRITHKVLNRFLQKLDGGRVSDPEK